MNLDESFLVERMGDIKIKLALLEYMDMEGKILAEENKALKSNGIFLLEENKKKILMKKINKYYNRINIKNILNKKMNIIYKAASVLLLAVIITSVTVFNVDALRIKLYNFILDMRDEYSNIKIEPADEAGTSIIKINWENAYAPALIPEGFKLSSVSNNELLKSLQYSDSDNNLIILQQYSSEGTINVDTENADTVLRVFVKGREGILVEKGNDITISWNYEDYIFIMNFINTGLSKEEAMKIAESVTKINPEAE